jgi:hypothetical protein
MDGGLVALVSEELTEAEVLALALGHLRALTVDLQEAEQIRNYGEWSIEAEANYHKCRSHVIDQASEVLKAELEYRWSQVEKVAEEEFLAIMEYAGVEDAPRFFRSQDEVVEDLGMSAEPLPGPAGEQAYPDWQRLADFCSTSEGWARWLEWIEPRYEQAVADIKAEEEERPSGVNTPRPPYEGHFGGNE